MTWQEVVRLAQALPGVEESSAYGTPALRLRGKFMCRPGEDGETLAIRCDQEERPLLVAAHPGTLFVTPHYENWPMVLVALPQADAELVTSLVEDVWLERAPKRVVDAYLAGREGGF